MRLSEVFDGKDAGAKSPQATPQRVVEDFSCLGTRPMKTAANRNRKTFSDRVYLLCSGCILYGIA